MKRKKNREGGLEKVSFTQRLKIIHEFMNEENKDEAKAQLLQMEELNSFSSCTIENCIFLQDLFIKLGLSIPRELLEREFALQKDTNKGLIKYLALVLNKVGHKLSFEEVWEVVFKRASTFSDEQSVKLSQLLIGHGQEVKSEEFLEIRSEFRAKRQQNAEKLQIATRWTFWDFARLFFALLIPAGMIFAQSYFWTDIQEFARGNTHFIIIAMEVSTALVLWYGVHKVLAIRVERIKLPKSGYDVLKCQSNSEEQIEMMEKKLISWEIQDFIKTFFILLIFSIIAYAGFQERTLEIFRLPLWGSWVIFIISFIFSIISVKEMRKEKKEKCAQQISKLKEYL